MDYRLLLPTALLLTLTLSLPAQDEEPVLPTDPALEIEIKRKGFRDLEQEERIRAKLPGTFARLKTKQHLRVVVIGDSVANYYTHDKNRHDLLRSFPIIFLKELAKDHFLTGSVRIVNPHKGKPAVRVDLRGPEIQVHGLSRNGVTSIEAQLQASIEGGDIKPHLALLNLGTNDARHGVPVSSYVEALEKTVLKLRAQETEVIIISPGPNAERPFERHLGKARPYTEAARDLARRYDAPFIDLGTLREALPSYSPPEESTQIRPRINENTRSLFEFGEANDGVHPNEDAHIRFGKSSHIQLFFPPESLPVQISDLNWTRISATELRADFRVTNTSEETQAASLDFYHVAMAWAPEETSFQIEMKAEEVQERSLIFRLQKRSPASTGWERALYNGHLPINCVVSTTKGSELSSPAGPVGPIHVEWPVGLSANVGEISFEAQISNFSEEAFSGEVLGEWGAQKLKGAIEIPGKSARQLKLKFKLPENLSVRNIKHPVRITATSKGGKEYVFTAAIEASRNLGLGESIPLPQADLYHNAKGDSYQPASSPGVLFTATADAKGLYLVYDIDGLELHQPKEGPSIGLNINLDARAYGKRLLPGATGALQIEFENPVSGPGKVRRPRLGAFGDTYDFQILGGSILPFLSERPDGGTRVAVTIPRKLFEGRHEWSIGNGNSQLGISTTLALAPPQGGLAANRTFFLTAPRMHRDDAESLGILELAKPSTKRWSVRLFH